MRRLQGVMAWFPWWLLTTCVASHPEAFTTERPSAGALGSECSPLDRLLTQGDIQVAEEHVQAVGFDSGPVDGILAALTRAAVRAFQS